MPHYVIHVGPHKTGSTYLQVLFQQLAEQLLLRGILYPLQWVASHAPGHSLLAEHLKTGQDVDALLAEFRTLHESKYKIVLISSEDLSNLPFEAISMLKSCLEGHKTSILFYCRRWLDLLPSSWQEIVKHGAATTLPEFLASNLMNPSSSTLINYAKLLDPFASVFGLEQLFLVSYNNIVDSGGDLAKHFFESFLCWPHAPVDTTLHPNLSLSLPDIEMIRSMNALDLKNGGQPSSKLRVKYLRSKSSFNLATPFASMDKSLAGLRLNENSQSLRVVHEGAFEKYGRRLVPPRSGRYFFVQKAGNIEYVNQDYLLADGVTEAIKSVYDQVRG